MLAKALESVVLVTIDRSDEANEPVVESFGFQGIPHFFLLRPDGAVRDRWVGYDDVPSWLAIFEASLADDTTLEEKLARFESAPNARDAAVLGRIRASEGKSVDAVRYYREAIGLDPGLARSLSAELFFNQARALDSGDCTLDEVRATADAFFALPDAPASGLVSIAYRMAGIAQDEGDWSLAAPYLAPAIAAAEGTSGWVAEARKELAVLEAMYVAGDKERGLALKRETLAEGWQDDAEELNAFAWWCFENGVNLGEAESLARRGAELATDGDTRAMILDTVAEIRNARGDPRGAAKWMEQALAADPGNEYYAKQKERFEEAARVLDSAGTR